MFKPRVFYLRNLVLLVCEFFTTVILERIIRIGLD